MLLTEPKFGPDLSLKLSKESFLIIGCVEQLLKLIKQFIQSPAQFRIACGISLGGDVSLNSLDIVK